MTGTTASISVSMPLPGLTVPPSFLTVAAPTTVPVAAPGTVPSLATFVDLMIGKSAAPGTALPVAERQDDAAPGKNLPDHDADNTEAALAWLFPATPPVAIPVDQPVAVATDAPPVASVAVATAAIDMTGLPVPRLPAGPTVDAPAVELPDATTRSIPTDLPVAPNAGVASLANAAVTATAAPSDTQPVPVPAADRGTAIPTTLIAPDIVAALRVEIAPPVIAAPQTATDPASPVAQPLPTAIAAALPAAQPATPVAAAATDGVQPAPADPVERATRKIATRIATSAPNAAPSLAPTAAVLRNVQPAVLASVIAAGTPQPALFALAAGRDRATDDESKPAISGVTTAAMLLQPADAVALIAKPGGARGQALDMGRQDWPQKMIDRIESLRDDANANDTSIRLKPEALGRIDIAVRTHGDGSVGVRFTAEQPTTRALIADAQPQLQAAADARGIRLSGTSVDLSGSGNAPDRQQPRFEPRQDNSNNLAATGETNEAVDDGRIA